MAQYMNRTPNPPGASIWDTPSGKPMQFLEGRYSSVGPQEWIYAPDAGPWYVTLFFPYGGAAFLEGSDEAPVALDGNRSNAPVVGLTPHYYPLTDTVVDITRVKIEGCTAVRVNVLGGSVDMTARC